MTSRIEIREKFLKALIATNKTEVTFQEVKDIKPREWSFKDYPNLKTMKVFNAK